MIKLIPRFFVSILVLTASLTASGQGVPLRYRVEAGTILTQSGKTPFWMRANQYGIVPVDGNFGTLRVGAHKDYDSTRNEQGKLKPWDLGYGASAAFNAGKKTSLLIPEAYLKIRFKALELYAGRRRETVGLIDTLLSSGSYIWSGNALPIPKVELSIPNYTSVLGRGLFSIKGNYAHGWFGNQGHTEGHYLHQKSLYTKLGRDSWNLNFYAGINHQVQWGGYSEKFKNDTLSSKYGYFASDPFTYLSIVIPVKWYMPPGKYSYYEYLNRFGNHLGSADLGLKVRTKRLEISLYRQTPYEDGQLPEVFLSWEGNYSVTFDVKNGSFLNSINFGYLDTRRQGLEPSKLAKFLGRKETHGGETQNYFNQWQYKGWVYEENGLGTPLIIPNDQSMREVGGRWESFTHDNMLQAFYGASNGSISFLTWMLQSSYTKSLGLYGVKRKVPLEQFSSRLSLQFPLSKLKLEAKVDLAYDKGKLYGDNLGGSLFLIKKW